MLALPAILEMTSLATIPSKSSDAVDIRMEPPPPKARNDYIAYIIVPGQLEKSAKKLFGEESPWKVYGEFWLLHGLCLSIGSREYYQAIDAVIANAEASYEEQIELPKVATYPSSYLNSEFLEAEANYDAEVENETDDDSDFSAPYDDDPESDLSE